MGGLSITHILVLLIIGVIFLRPKKIPEMGQSLGKAIKNFKEAMNEIEVDPKDLTETPSKKVELEAARQAENSENKKS